MSDQKRPLHMLFLEDARQSADTLVSQFRNAGYATRSHRITSLEDLEDALRNQHWDLLMAFEKAEIMSPDHALSVVINAGITLPALLLLEETNDDRLVEWLSTGGADAVPFNQTRRLLFVAKREWETQQLRRKYRQNLVSLKEAEKRCQLLLDSSMDAIAYVHEGMHIHANPAYVELFGFEDVDDLAGLSLIDIIDREYQNDFKSFFRQFHQDMTASEMEFCGRRDDGQTFKAVMNLSRATWDEESCTQIVIRQAAADPQLALEIENIKSRDLITGLYNRDYILKQLEQSLQMAMNDTRNSAILDIRLDKFRDLRKDLGVIGTDRLLSDVADVLQPLIEAHGELARFGDDIFIALIQHDVHSQLEELAQTIIASVARHEISIDQGVYRTTASVGIMSVTENASDVSYLLDRAQKACLAALASGGNQFKLHDRQAELDSLAQEGNTVAMVQKAFNNGQFKLSFQPILCLENETEESYEVFSRLENEDGKILDAAEFMPACHSAGLTTKIDRWVLVNAIKHLADHRKKGHASKLFVTLSAASILDPTLPSWLSVALKAAKLPADSLVVQLPEEEIAPHPKQAAVLANNLKQIHCSVCITHFGCTLDPYALLKSIPADMVKLDAPLTENIATDQESYGAVEEMINTLHNRGKLVLVPKVEDNQTLSTLWSLKINYIQGHFLQPPMAAMEFDFN